MKRMADDPYNTPPGVRSIIRLHRAGWSVGDFATSDGAGGIVFVVAGTNGENVIRAEGRTVADAWRTSAAQARSLGMLDRDDDPPG